MADEHRKTIADIEIAEAVIAHEAVDCFCGHEQKESVQPQSLASCAGGVFWGKQGEQWPTSSEGSPLIPWLQVVCTEMAGLYGAFYQRQAICFYIREDFDGYEAASSFDGSHFVVREYALDDDLEPLMRPATLENHPFHQIVWKKRKDYPSISKYYGLFDPAVYKSLCERKDFRFENRPGIKIGGWPTPVQRGQEYPGAYDLQIDMTENFMYGDSGVAYLSRTGKSWYVLFECC